MSNRTIEQQVIAITGAATGIGRGTALLAGSRGARVVLIAGRDEPLAATIDLIRAQGGQAIAVPADVAVRDQLDAAVAVALAVYGRIDTWVNAAGIGIFGRLEDIVDADNRRLFEVNFWGVVNGSLAALAALRASGGVLINLGSEVAATTLPLQGMYAASKLAAQGFSAALRGEIGGEPAPEIVLIEPAALAASAASASPLPDVGQVAAAILHAAEQGGRRRVVTPA